MAVITFNYDTVVEKVASGNESLLLNCFDLYSVDIETRCTPAPWNGTVWW